MDYGASVTPKRIPEQEIVFDRETWTLVRNDPRLRALLRLGRVINALTLAGPAVLTPGKYNTPRARRDRANGLLYAGAVLYEALGVSRSLGKYFRHLEQYRAGFGALQRDKSVKTLESRYLKRLRDQIVFHFDEEVFGASLDAMTFREYRFASASGWSARTSYFDLVDDAVLLHLTGKLDDEEHMRELEVFAFGTADLFSRFLEAANILMPPALAELGARMRRLDRRTLVAE